MMFPKHLWVAALPINTMGASPSFSCSLHLPVSTFLSIQVHPVPLFSREIHETVWKTAAEK